MLKDLKEKIKEYWLWIVVIIIGIIATFCFFYFSKDKAQAGLIGDTLSGVFTSLAFICAIFAVALQRKELSLQRKELEQTREELRGQKEQFEIQNKTLKRQQFENTFFNMLENQNNITYNLEFGIEGHNSYRAGRRVFEEIYYLLKDKIQKEQKIFCEEDKKLREEIIKIYDSIYFVKNLDHYFRHMYRIVKFVKETDFSFCLDDKEDKNKTEEEKQNKMKDEKYQYTSILRATLSPYELALLFYNCLNKEENKSRKNKFSPLIEEYCLLQNIRSEFLKKETLGYYKNEAYGNRYEDIKKELEKNN